jgi:uncharacterized membrane protein YozB (DUF420 family)
LIVAEVNLFMQTIWTSLVVISMWFRRRGNYLVHGALMALVVGVTLVSFSLVLVMSPPTGGSMQGYFTSPINIAQFVSHAILSIPAIACGTWLVLLWRPHSATFPAKTEKLAKAAAILWVLSYVAGALGYAAAYTALFK